MATITISKNLIKEKELVVIPRREYEGLLSFKKIIKEFHPTTAQKLALATAERNLRSGKTLSYKEANDITNVNAQSKSFDFLNNEPELYAVSDLKKKYVSR